MKHFCFISGDVHRFDALMFERQGKSLVQAGYKVTYVVCDDLPDATKDGIHFVSIRFQPKNRFDRFFRTRAKLLKYAKEIDADIYQLYSPEHITMVKPLKKLGKKVVFNMRENFGIIIAKKTYIPKPLRKWAQYFYSKMMRRSFMICDAVFPVSIETFELVHDHWGIKQSYMLPNFPRVNKGFNLSFEEYNKRGNVLNYEGTIYNISMQENVFAALEHIPDVTYFLTGKFANNEYAEKIKSHSYWPKVRFMDGFRQEDLKDIFAQSSMANVARIINGKGSFGILKVFESMEAALPVLFPDAELYREINQKYHCGICVDITDVSSIEKAVRYLVNNKKEAYQMGQNGRNAVVEEFNWERFGDMYVKKVNEILGLSE